jgi:hypothetical protein
VENQKHASTAILKFYPPSVSLRCPKKTSADVSSPERLGYVFGALNISAFFP